MTIRCIGCGRAIRVPDEKAQNPRLKVKCTCGTVFALAEAMSAAETAASAERAVVAPDSLGPQVETHVSDIPATETSSPLEELVDTPPALAEPVPARRTRPPGGWRRCVNHHAAQSQSVCTRCQIGYCPDCEQRAATGVVCPVCEDRCVPALQFEDEQEQKRQRQRSMMDELEVIGRYPLHDPIALAGLAVVSGALGFFARFEGAVGALAILLSQTALVWGCFIALDKVAEGSLKDLMPRLDDLGSLMDPLRLGLAVLIASAGPLIAIYLWSGIGVAKSFLVDAGAPAVRMEAVRADDQQAVATSERTQLEGGALLVATLLLIPAIFWKIVYTPAALTVAQRSRSLLSVLKPPEGLAVIRKMGPVYWQAMLIYAVLALGQWLVGFVLSWIPFVGGVAASFVNAYVYLAVGCTLGLALFKTAPDSPPA